MAQRRCHKIVETPGPHFHYDFWDPSVNLGTPSVTWCKLMFIVELKNQRLPCVYWGQQSS